MAAGRSVPLRSLPEVGRPHRPLCPAAAGGHRRLFQADGIRISASVVYLQHTSLVNRVSAYGRGLVRLQVSSADLAAIQARSAHTKSAFVTHPTESEKQLENSGNSKPSAVFTASINGSHTGEASERQPLGLRLAFFQKVRLWDPPTSR